MVRSKETFSVVIPCFNDAVHIGRAVRSCLNQSVQAHEIIIVDDGSNEATRQTISELAAEYGDQGVRAKYLVKNSGVSTARNTGIASATGSYICFLDSDDAWHFDKLKAAQQILSQLKHPAALGNDFTFVLEDLTIPRSGEPGKVRRVTTLELLFKNPLMTSSWVIPNRGLTFRYDFRYSEDHEFLLRLSTQFPIYRLNEKLSFQSRPVNSKGGLSSSRWRMRKGEMKMYVNFFRSNWVLMPLLPIFIMYSLAKHSLKILFNVLR